MLPADGDEAPLPPRLKKDVKLPLFPKKPLLPKSGTAFQAYSHGSLTF